MTKSAAANSSFDDDDTNKIGFNPDMAIDPIDFIDALAALVRGTVDRLGNTAGSVTGALMVQSSKVDRSLVVALQDFDRLQQEFVALSDALTRSAGALRAASSAQDLPSVGRDAISAIAVSDLPERLLSHLQFVAENMETQSGVDEEVF